MSETKPKGWWKAALDAVLSRLEMPAKKALDAALDEVESAVAKAINESGIPDAAKAAAIASALSPVRWVRGKLNIPDDIGGDTD
jgi:hypothetical protein